MRRTSNQIGIHGLALGRRPGRGGFKRALPCSMARAVQSERERQVLNTSARNGKAGPVVTHPTRSSCLLLPSQISQRRTLAHNPDREPAKGSGQKRASGRFSLLAQCGKWLCHGKADKPTNLPCLAPAVATLQQ